MPSAAFDKAQATRAPDSVRLVDGRLVAAQLSDPPVKKRLAAAKTAQRKRRSTLLNAYVKAGILTQSGKLTQSFGG